MKARYLMYKKIHTSNNASSSMKFGASSFSGTLGLRSRVPSGASSFSGTWDPGPNKGHKNRVMQVTKGPA